MYSSYFRRETERGAKSVREEDPGEERAAVRSPTREKTFPLNSERLTATIVTCIAKGLHLPLSASLEETRHMIEGELLAEREPRNVQVDIQEAAAGVTIRLRDEGGVFLEVLPDEPSDGGRLVEASDADKGEESEDGGAHGEEPRSREMLERRRLRSGAIEESDRDAGSRELELEQKVVELTQEKTELMGENVYLTQERTMGGRTEEVLMPDITAGYMTHPPEEQKATPTRRGKAPPVHPFSGETPDVIFDD